VHRDLKPDNILVATSGEPKVADFGLAHLAGSAAQLTRTGAKQGTPMYMAPEQVEGRTRDVAERTDVYALGAILYEILTGRPPFTGETLAEVFSKILSQDPVPPRQENGKIPQDLETIALKALEKDPARRYGSAGAFAEELRRFLAGEQIAARPLGLADRTLRRVRRNPLVYGLAAGAMLAALAALGIGVAGARKEKLLGEEKHQSLENIRKVAQVSLDGALVVRRAGDPSKMTRFLSYLEEAYGQTTQRDQELPEVDYLMGRMYRALGQDAKALEFQERALRKDPFYALALFERVLLNSKSYGREFARASDARRALGAEFRTPGPGEAEVPSQLELLKAGIVRDCVSLAQVLAKGPSPAPAVPVTEAHLLAAQGILAYYQLQLPEARKALEEAVQKDPTLDEAWDILCRAASDQATAAKSAPGTEEMVRKSEEAELLYARGISFDRGYLPLFLGRGNLRISRAYFLVNRGKGSLKDFAGAEEDFTQALTLDPKSVDALLRRGDVRNNRGLFLMTRGQDPLPDYELAERDFEEALGLDPRSVTAMTWLGNLLVNRGLHGLERNQVTLADFDKAEKVLSQALALDDRHISTHVWRGQARLHRARSRQEQGGNPLEDLGLAEADFTRAIEVDARVGGSWMWRGVARTLRGEYQAGLGKDPTPDFEKARLDLVRLLELDTNSSPGLLRMGILEARRGRHRMRSGQDPLQAFGDAEGHFKRSLEIHKEHSETWVELGDVRLLRAAYYESHQEVRKAKEDYARAAQDFGEALKLNPAREPKIAPSLSQAKEKAAKLGP
jgi:tetratricopeptide (TPR) repeat protein